MVVLYRTLYIGRYSRLVQFCHLGHRAATLPCINLFGFGSITILRDVNKYCSTIQARSGCHLGKRAIIIRKSLVASI